MAASPTAADIQAALRAGRYRLDRADRSGALVLDAAPTARGWRAEGVVRAVLRLSGRGLPGLAVEADLYGAVSHADGGTAFDDRLALADDRAPERRVRAAGVALSPAEADAVGLAALAAVPAAREAMRALLAAAAAGAAVSLGDAPDDDPGHDGGGGPGGASGP